MTENEMRERMKEIDKQREELKSERKKYENYFYDKKRKELLDDHKKFEGKCFLQRIYQKMSISILRLLKY